MSFRQAPTRLTAASDAALESTETTSPVDTSAETGSDTALECPGRTEQVLATRQEALDAAYTAHPERFVHGRPVVAQLPSEVWINKPVEVPSATEGVAQS